MLPVYIYILSFKRIIIIILENLAENARNAGTTIVCRPTESVKHRCETSSYRMTIALCDVLALCCAVIPVPIDTRSACAFRWAKKSLR